MVFRAVIRGRPGCPRCLKHHCIRLVHTGMRGLRRKGLTNYNRPVALQQNKLYLCNADRTEQSPRSWVYEGGNGRHIIEKRLQSALFLALRNLAVSWYSQGLSNGRCHMDYASETLTGRASVRPAVIDTYFCVWALRCRPTVPGPCQSL